MFDCMKLESRKLLLVLHDGERGSDNQILVKLPRHILVINP